MRVTFFGPASVDSTLFSALVTVAMLFGCASAHAPPAVDARAVPPDAGIPGAKRFVFTQWAGPPVPVWYLRPDSAGADAPLVFVMHGVRRDADRYLKEWVEVARQYGFVVAVPEFTAKDFPGARSYNFGAVFNEDATEVPRERWSYSAIEPIFDAVCSVEGLKAKQYWLFGHSAGAQFAHRFAMLGLGKRMKNAISANAGSYMLATTNAHWPFGVSGAPGGPFDFARAFAAPLIVLLGDADTDPNHPSLPHQPEADAQGPHRFARGQKFYNDARLAAATANAKFAWSCVIAPSVAHDNGRMAGFAARLITGRAHVSPGADCARLM